MKPLAILLHPSREANHPFVQSVHAVDTLLSPAPLVSHLVAILVSKLTLQYHNACVQVTFVLLNNGPKV